MKENKAVYILGGGQLGLNIIKWAREVGLKTIVSDRNKNAPGLKKADKSIVLDSTDIKGHLAQVELLKNTYDIVGVYCGNEIGLWTVYYICKSVGLKYNSSESIEIVLDKVKMKKIWQKSSLSTPVAHVVKDHQELSEFISKHICEYVVKPALGSGSRGVQIINQNSDCMKVFDLALDSVGGKGEVLVEEYIEGRSIDVNGLFIENKFYPAGVLEKYASALPDCLPLGGNDPADISQSEKETVYGLFENGCRQLGIVHGPVKGDLLRTQAGKYYLLEVAPRMHGDVTTSNTIPYGTSINPVKFYFKYLKKGILDLSLINDSNSKYAAWRVLCFPPGKILSELNDDDIIQNQQITKIWYNHKCNGFINKYVNTTTIPGYICAYGKDKVDVELALENYFDQNQIDIDIDEKQLLWYRKLGKRLESHGFSKKSCGYIDV